jgi:hypothetical protein
MILASNVVTLWLSFFFWKYSRHLPFCSTLCMHAPEAREFSAYDPYSGRLASIVTHLSEVIWQILPLKMMRERSLPQAGIVARPSSRMHGSLSYSKSPIGSMSSMIGSCPE